MNDVYNYILIRDLKKLPKHGQSFDAEKLARLLGGSIGLQSAFNLVTDDAKKYSLALDKVAIAQGINSRLAKQYIADLGKVLPGQIANIKAKVKLSPS